MLRCVSRRGDCPSQAFVLFDDAAVIGHLTGRHVMGVYPLLSDETCWFLAVDFDKSTWIVDVSAFVETCQRVGIPAAVERSRSGNAAHVWFFFTSPMSAAAARKPGGWSKPRSTCSHSSPAYGRS
ncbi:MAG: TOTE conflict system archaeo-eukaryotic primase domain-containing protein [Steroidobacteraceae bacterium]